jgi:hypothetical protein
MFTHGKKKVWNILSYFILNNAKKITVLESKKKLFDSKKLAH